MSAVDLGATPFNLDPAAIAWVERTLAGLSPDAHIAMDRPWHDVPCLMVSFGYPLPALRRPRVPTYVNAYGSHDRRIQEAVVECLLGRAPFAGTNPIDPFCGIEDARY